MRLGKLAVIATVAIVPLLSIKIQIMNVHKDAFHRTSASAKMISIETQKEFVFQVGSVLEKLE